MTSNHLLLHHLAERMLEEQHHVLAVDTLFDDDIIADFVKSIQIDSPYQQMLLEGVLTESVRDEKLFVSFTVEGYFHFVLGDVIFNLSKEKDHTYFIELLQNNQLNGIKEGVEQCLIQEVNQGKLDRLVSLIDAGGVAEQVARFPLVHAFMKNRVENVFNILMENPSVHDWRVLIKVDKVTSDLNLHQLRREIAIEALSRNNFSSKTAIEFGLIGLPLIDRKSGEEYLSAIEQVAAIYENDADICIGLGKIFDHFADYDKALAFYQKSLDILLCSLGAEHPDVASMYNQIGDVWRSKGEYNKSLHFFQKALKIRISADEEEHPNLAYSYNYIGVVHLEMNENVKALECLQRSLEIFLKRFGQWHPDVASTYQNIGGAWYGKEEYETSLSYFQRCLDIELKTLGAKHTTLTTSYNNIGSTWNALGNYDRALEFHHRCLEIALNAHGTDHPKVASSYSNIGLVWEKKGNYEKALEFLMRSLNIRLNILGVEHPHLAELYSCIGSVWERKGDYNKALGFHQQCLDIRLKILGARHPYLSDTYFDFGSCYKQLGMYEHAIEHFMKGFQIESKGGFPFQIAQCYEALFDFNAAFQFYLKSAEIRRNNEEMGVSHKATQVSIENARRLAFKLKRERELPKWIF